MGQNVTLVKRLNSVEEFEREPVPESKLKGLKSFIGMYAGEHTAGTEFVIGFTLRVKVYVAGNIFTFVLG